MSKKAICLSIMVFAATALMAQHQTGLRPHGSVTGLYFNPASFQASNAQWDLLLVAGGAFAETDYAYIANTSVAHLLLNDQYFFDATFADGEIPDGQTPYYFVDAHRPMNNSIQVFAGSPGFATRLRRQWSAAVFARSRVGFAANNVSPMWSWPELQAWQYATPHNSAPIHIAAAAYTEIALNVGFGTKKGAYRTNFGVNLKALLPHEALYAYAPSTTEITLSKLNYYVNTNSAEIAFTDFEQNASFSTKGGGFGADLGMVIQKTQDGDAPYRWQLSLSVTDIGAMRIGKQATKYKYANNQTTIISREAYTAVGSIAEFAEETVNQVLLSGGSAQKGTAFVMVLPTAFRSELDYHIGKNWYANAAMARWVQVHPAQLQVENMWSVSVRYATKWLSWGVPLVVLNDNNLRFGAWLRIGPLTLGSDHLPSLVTRQARFNGSDIYFAIRLSDVLFTESAKKKAKQNSPEKCYWL